MRYVHPTEVTSPKEHVKDVQVLVDKGEGEWSAALVTWKGEKRLGIRWNGDAGAPRGNPQSRGISTWFLLPEELEPAFLAAIRGIEVAPRVSWIDQLKKHNVRWLRIRPLPKRIWNNVEQEPVDHDWLLEKINEPGGNVIVRNVATGHFVGLYDAHVKRVIPNALPPIQGEPVSILELTVQMVFEDGHVRLEAQPAR